MKTAVISGVKGRLVRSLLFFIPIFLQAGGGENGCHSGFNGDAGTNHGGAAGNRAGGLRRVPGAGKPPHHSRCDRRHPKNRSGTAAATKRRRKSAAGDGTLQKSESIVSPGKHRGAGRRSPDRRGQADGHGGALFGGKRGADRGNRPGSQGGRRGIPPGRRIQTPQLALQFPGPQRRRTGAVEDRPGRHWFADCQRNHVGVDAGSVRGGSGCDPDRRPQHAEFRFAEGGGADPQARAAEARHERHDRGIPHVRRIHPGRGK